ncbi:MAG: DUF2851 family protein [Muribaculaceae bacterium]|nr:DUF2851 family protein [Muribaculaceae bacterium]
MEKLYQYLWQTGIAGKSFRLVDGRSLEVIDPGRLNSNSGPDFFNSKVRIDGTEWVGNVEIHVKASDWKRHGHDSDSVYDSVLLHVVAVSDTRIARKNGELIPQLEIVLPQSFYTAYASLDADMKAVRCQNYLQQLSSLTMMDWLESLAVERIQVKASRVAEIYRATASDWDQTLFIILARAFGFGLNGEPFEMLARSMPLRIIYHHADSRMQIEALLFGQAGMLDAAVFGYDDYYQTLCREYLFLSRKYGLSPIPAGMWKYSRSRPQNFPHRRLAFLAAILFRGLFSIRQLASLSIDSDRLRELFKVNVEDYWTSHYSFGTPETIAPAELSRGSIDILMGNVVAPVVYAYGCLRGDMDLAERGINLLYELPPENNTITRQWKEIGIKNDSALRSQALIHLRKEYCDARNCLRCRFAHSLLRKEANIWRKSTE